MNGFMRTWSNSTRHGTEPSRSNSASSEVSSFNAHPNLNLFHAHAFPLSTKRPTWPLSHGDAATRPFSMMLGEYLTRGDRLERIRMGGAPVDRRVLPLQAALEALNGRDPGAHAGNHGRKPSGATATATGHLAQVFDEASGKFTGWRPKVATWGCGADKDKARRGPEL